MKLNSNKEIPTRILNWVKKAINLNAIVTSVEKLKGSTSSTLHRISLQSNQKVHHIVVRQFDNKEWLEQEPDLAVHEARSLRMAARTGIKTPEIIAFDESRRECGVPAVLMTMLEGKVILQPGNRQVWLNGLAETLADIHTVKATDFPYSYFTYQDIPTLEVPKWSAIPEKWEKAIKIVQGPRPKIRECFIHRDYHPANVLWKKGTVSGVVDWVNACKGPAGIDVGHCRVNLAQLYNVETADAFLKSYQHYAGVNFHYDPYWDFVSLIDILLGPPEVYPGWEAFGVTGLTNQMMEQRLDRYVGSLLDKV